MSETTMLEPTLNNGYQIIVVNISYKKTPGFAKERPATVTLDVPEGILKCKSNKEKFYDSVEQFAYNTITKKYGAEVNRCQVWLPLEEKA